MRSRSGPDTRLRWRWIIAADEAGVGDGVVGRAEGPAGDQGLAGRQQSGDGVDFGGG